MSGKRAVLSPPRPIAQPFGVSSESMVNAIANLIGSNSAGPGCNVQPPQQQPQLGFSVPTPTGWMLDHPGVAHSAHTYWSGAFFPAT